MTSSPKPQSSSPESTAPAPRSATRRKFLHDSGAVVVGASLAGALSPPLVHAAGDDVLRVGLIGCGGRGKGAAVNAMRGDPNLKLVALGDAFEDQLRAAQGQLQRQLNEKYAVDADHAFHGFDAFQNVIDSGVDVVLLATPPHFRPQHLRAAIEAGKHVFCEKPVAVDAPGVRHVLESTEMARKQNLALVSGLCWRYDYGVRETMDRILNGAIGDVVAIQENYLTGTLWHRGRKPDWSEMEYQMRNWLYFTWLSGDHIVEQHIHSLDKALWLMGDQPPARCVGLGGRQVRSSEQWGNIYDHFAVCYEWQNGVKTFAYTRQMKDCFNNVEDYVLGTKGRAKVLAHQIEGESEWKYKGPTPSMYDVEHKELFASIRANAPINNGIYMSYSTLLAIMGREVCYTGKELTWEQALNSEQKLGPTKYAWGDVDQQPVAMPGQVS